MPDAPVISNNTPLVALYVLGRLDLLNTLFGEVLIPPAVQQEFLATERAQRQEALDNAPWIQVSALAQPYQASSFGGLDEGEAEVLALATERDARLVIMDERRGRQYAKRLSLPLTGTLGGLLLAKSEGLIVELAPLITELQNAGPYLAPELINKTLKLAGEVNT